MANSFKNKLGILGLSAAAIASSLALSGCSKRDLVLAQQNIDNSAVKLLNSNEVNSDFKFKYFTFLGADVDVNDNVCNVDINGISTNSKKEKAYTTFNYTVDKSYFPNFDNDNKYDNNAKLINSLSDIINNEKLTSYSILNVDDVKQLNTTAAKITNSNLDDEYKCQGNFLYSVNNLNFNEQEQFASFSTKEFIKYAKTKVNYWAFTENGPIYTIDSSRKSFFTNQNIYVELTPEEIANAKLDSSLVFNKLIEYVENNQTEKYVVEQTSVSENQEKGIVMNEEVSLSNT